MPLGASRRRSFEWDLMSKGLNGQKRPADAISLAIMVGKITTGEVGDGTADPAKSYHSEGGEKGVLLGRLN
jgi:hypothetical protein